MTYIKTTQKFHALLTRMRINAKISFFTQNTVKMVLVFRAKVLFFNENQAENGLKMAPFICPKVQAVLKFSLAEAKNHFSQN